MNDRPNEDMPSMEGMETMYRGHLGEETVEQVADTLMRVTNRLAAGMEWISREFPGPVSAVIKEDFAPILASFEVARRYVVEKIISPLGRKAEVDESQKKADGFKFLSSKYLLVNGTDQDNKYVRFIFFFSEMWRRVAYDTFNSLSMTLFRHSRREGIVIDTNMINNVERSISRCRESIFVAIELVESAVKRHEKPGWVSCW